MRQFTVEALVERAGGVKRMALLLGVSHSSVIDWKHAGYIPGGRALQISQVLHIDPKRILKLVRPNGERYGRVSTKKVKKEAEMSVKPT